MKGDAIRMNRDFIEKAMSALRWNMKLSKKTEILRVRAKISLHFRRMDLGQICSIRGCKTTGIASYFEDFGVEDRAKLA